jgi:hypothetical protein
MMNLDSKTMRHQSATKTFAHITAALAALCLSAQALAQIAKPAPSWVTNITPGTWAQVSLNTLADVDPEDDPSLNPNYPGNAPWHGNNGQDAVINTWNGGVFAAGLGEFGSLIMYGGGHAGYYGSEVYAFDLATRKWSRLSAPYKGPYNWPYSKAEYPDGSAIPPHTYDFVEYHPRTNSFVLLKGQTELGPPSNETAVPTAHAFDLGTRKWRRSPQNGDVNIYSGGFSVYDSKRDVFWVEGGASSSNFLKFDPNTSNGDGTFGTWTNYERKVTQTDSMAGYDPDNDLFVVTAFRNGTQVYGIDLANPTAARVQLKEGGTLPDKRSAHGWEWSEGRKAFIYWRSGSEVYEFKQPSGDWKSDTWQWSKITSGSNSLSPQAMEVDNGVYSRFRIARFADAEVAVVVNRIDGPVYAFRVPTGTIVRPNAPTSVTAQ